MFRALLPLFVIVLLSPTCFGEEKKAAKKPSGKFAREVGDRKLVFDFKADTLTIHLTEGDRRVTAHAAYGVTGDGLLFGVITRVEKKGTEDGPGKGDLFSFQFEESKTEFTISDLKGTRINDEARKLVEGVYKIEK